MSKGTILYIGGFELPDKNAAAHRVLSNGKILRDLGYNPVFIGIDKSLARDSRIQETRKYIQGFECWSVPYPDSNLGWYKYLTNIKSIEFICKEHKNVKAIIAYNYPSIALFKLKDYCRRKSIKIFADCTEWYSTEGYNILFKIIKGLDSFLRMRILQKRMDGLIVISRFLENYYKNCRNVIRIPPLIDIKEEKWEVKDNYQNDNKIKFVYSGTPGKNKDKINFLLEALYSIKEYDNYVFNIIGITKEQYISEYPEHHNILATLEENINFIGRISHEDSLRELKASDFCIFIREKSKLTQAGFPTKFVESISCGIPVITTNTSDLSDYMVEHNNGFYLDDSREIINVEKIKSILSLDKKTISQMKEYCLKNSTFDYRNFQEKMNQLVN